MGVEITEERFVSPFRDDERPTCSIRRMSGNGQLYFMDWAVLDKALDVFGLYMYVHGCDFSEAVDGLFDLMAGDRSKKTPQLSSIRVKQLSETRLSATSRDWLQTDLNWWMTFGIDKQTLEFFQVSAARFVWLGDDIVYQHSSPQIFPAYLYKGPSSLKAYFPHRTEFRFYHNNANHLQGLEQLPLSGEMVVITKSLKDVMTLYRFNVPAVAPQSESIVITPEQLANLRSRFTHVVVLFDNDHAGINALRRYKKLNLRVFMLSRHNAKDISDYYRKYGAEMTREIISNTKESYLQG